MNNKIQLLANPSFHDYQDNRAAPTAVPETFSKANFLKVQNFHRSLDEYRETPIFNLQGLAGILGLKGIFVKDESQRFGLNSFKALGASYAISRLLQEHSEEKPKVFVTATDGNHGKGVAWAASRVGGQAYVFMPKGSQDCRVQAIRDVGDTVVEVTEMNYDDTVRYATAFAREQGYFLVQDTGFEGYEEIPRDIMLGYSTMAAEAVSQMEAQGIAEPTHVFLQAGVGSMAGGVLGFLANYFGPKLPKAVIMEAEEAACIYESMKTGETVAIGGHPRTIMAGLNCGEPNIHVLEFLRNFAWGFAKCPDWVTAQGMRKLANPEPGDPTVVSGESGAVGLGLVMSLCQDPEYLLEKERLGLDKNSIVLLFSTEGDTDPENYQNIISQEPGEND